MSGSGNKGTVIAGNPPLPTSKKPILPPPGDGGSGGANPSSRSPSTSGSTNSFHFVDDAQTLPEPGEFASLDLLHTIIQYLGHDLGNTKRLTFSCLRAVSHIAKIYKKIYELIKKVDGTDSPDWTSYDKYSKAIEPLENLLFQFACDADSEKLSSKKLIQDLIAADGSVYKPTDCISVVSVWEADRTLVKKLLDSLKTEKDISAIAVLAESEAKECLRHDDEMLLSALADNIIKQNPRFGKRASDHIQEIKSKVGDINTEFKTKAVLEDASSIKCVSSLMLVNEALEAHNATSIDASGANKEWNVHLKTHTVWETAKSLLTTVHEHIKDATKIKYAALKDDYDAFVKALYSGKFELPTSLLDLIKKAARVKRPFYLQSLVLVAICKELADEFNKDAAKSVTKFIPLDETLTAGVAALTQAAQAVDDLDSLDEASHKQKSDALFGAVNTKLTECLNAYNKQSDEATYKASLTAALNRDKIALERIQKKLKGLTPFNQSNVSDHGSDP